MEYKEWALAEGYIPLKLDSVFGFDEAKEYFDKYELVNPIHVIEYAAFEKLQKDWEEAATQNYADKCEIEKLKSNLNNVRNNLIEAESQNNDKCWFNVEIILRQTIDSINEVLK